MEKHIKWKDLQTLAAENDTERIKRTQISNCVFTPKPMMQIKKEEFNIGNEMLELAIAQQRYKQFMPQKEEAKIEGQLKDSN